ncbi:MAG: DUF4424 family protein [Casimicrobium sp.]
MKKFVFASALASLATILAVPSSANDSSAAIGLGGLELTQNDAISMDSEDLFLSRALVRVKYRYTNTSAKDIETLVSFPLPPIPQVLEGYIESSSFSDWKDQLKFKTLINGKAADLAYREEIVLADRPAAKNLAQRLKDLKWPIRYWDDYEFEQKFIEPLSAAEKAKLVAEGLLRKDADSDYHAPNWQIQAHVTRKQMFPAGKTISVEHSYQPIAGGSVGGALNAEYRKDPGMGFKDYAAAYCIDKAFLAGFDKRYAANKKKAAARGDDYGVAYMEHWLDYVLTSGANWKGPIKDFRLVIDKEKPDNLLSMCMTGVKKISPTRFEVRKTNFEPAQDIKILIAEFYDLDAG